MHQTAFEPAVLAIGAMDERAPLATLESGIKPASEVGGRTVRPPYHLCAPARLPSRATAVRSSTVYGSPNPYTAIPRAASELRARANLPLPSPARARLSPPLSARKLLPTLNR